MTADVERTFTATVAEHLRHRYGARVPVQLLYRRGDPHAVMLRLCGLHGPRLWRVSRHTLREGLMFRTALDLVARVEPLGESGQVRISLTSEKAGHVVFDMPGPELLAALDDTGLVVPFGREHEAHDWDDWLRGVTAQ